MPEAQRTIVIERPLDEVFAFFSNPANDMRWRSDVVAIGALEHPKVGARIPQKIAGPGGRAVSADIEVTAYDPPSRYAFQVVAGPVRPRGEFTFTSVPSGTEVTFHLSAELSGLKRLIMSRMVQSSMNGEVGALDRAKTVLEGS